jgi:hypothetical protein
MCGGSDIFQQAGDALASVDPGPAIGKGLAEVDTFVNREIPGGWTLPAVIAVAYTTGYFDPSMLATEGAATTGAGGVAGGGAFVPAAGSGASFVIPEGAAYVAGAAGAGGTGAAVYGTTEGALQVGNLAYSNALANGATVAEANAAADAATQTYMATGYQGAAGTGNLLPSVSGEIGANIGTGASSGFGLNPALPAIGAAGVGGGISSALPSGAILGTGLNGGEIGVSYLAGANGAVATDIFGQPILANSINFGGFPADMGITGSDVLNTVNDARKAYNTAKFANSLINPTDISRLRSAGLPTGASSSGAQQDSSSQAGGTVTGALPGNLKETSLAAAPALQGTNMNLTQLKQLYPQLAQVDPRILSSLTGKNASIPSYYSYGSDQSAGGTALSSQSQGNAPQPGYPSIAADNKNINTGFATPTSPSSSYNALSSAGLQAINTGALPSSRYFKDGGNVHVPQFKTGTTGHFVQGAGDGQSDDIPAMLADGEYVFDADTVAALGNGSSKAGALQLDKMRKSIRKHKRSASTDKIPPKAKSPLEYLKGR